MLINNVEQDIKTKCVEEGKSQAQIADAIGITTSYVNKIVRRKEPVVNKTFLAMMDQLGYNVRLVYEKKES